MALINVGIHENLTLSDKSKINEHGTLELVVKSIEDDNAVFAALAGNTVVQTMESSIRMYPPNLLDFDKNLKSAADVAKDMSIIRHQFLTYGKLFAPKEDVEAAIGGLQMFEGLGIPPEDMAKAFQALTREDFLHRVVTNLSTKFLGFLQAHNAFDGSVTFRQKFLRQSKPKNFIAISSSSFDVWLEPMTIPKEQSRIAYSDWEIKNGRNSSSDAPASGKQSGTAETAKAAALFGDDTTATPSGGTEVKELPVDNKPGLFS